MLLHYYATIATYEHNRSACRPCRPRYVRHTKLVLCCLHGEEIHVGSNDMAANWKHTLKSDSRTILQLCLAWTDLLLSTTFSWMAQHAQPVFRYMKYHLVKHCFVSMLCANNDTIILCVKPFPIKVYH